MFGKFLRTPECMEVLSWFINHDEGMYSAAIIAIECNMKDMSTFMGVLTVLEGTDFIFFDELNEEELKIGLNKNSSGVQLLLHLKDDFNDLAFRSEQVSPALAYLNSEKIKETIDSQLLEKFDSEDVLKMCKNYKDLDVENELEKEIHDICLKLDEQGEYEEFIERMEAEMKK